MRGGNWYNGLTTNGVNDGHSRVANRNPSYYRGPQDPNHPWYHIGFRIARGYARVSVSIGANTSDTIFEGTSVTFTAIPVNGGDSPTFQWKVNGSDAGENSAVFTYEPANNDQIGCLLTSSMELVTGNPATSNMLSMTVIPLTLSVDPSNRDVTSSAGNTTFTVSSNTSWSAISDQNWCTVTPSGTGDGIITVTYEENTTITARVANITVSVTGKTPVVATITQAGIPCINPTADAGNDVTILDTESLQLAAAAENYQSILWTSSGDGTFDNPAILNPVYYPRVQDIENSTVEISLTAASGVICNLTASDALILTILRQTTLEIPAGWSGFSSFVVPLNPAFDELMAPAADNLVMAKTFMQVYWPEFGINTIGDLDVFQGYFVKMDEPVSISVVGYKSIEKTINLSSGWNILPVISENEVGCQELTTQLGENLIIVTEISGNLVYWPEAGVYSLTTLVPGKAYLIKALADCNFIFPD